MPRRLQTILLLGKRDTPTDGIADYCALLASAIAARGAEVQIVRLRWSEEGWWRALARLRREAAAWKNSAVLLQYTALQWSARGLPLAVPLVLSLLRRSGARVGIVYHDPAPYSPRTGAGAIRALLDRFRMSVQRSIMRAAARRAALSILTVPPGSVAWLPAGARVLFLPVGANVPASDVGAEHDEPDSIVVFAFSGPPALSDEVAAIGAAVRLVAPRPTGLRVIACGRNAELAGAPLRRALEGTGVAVDVLGVVPAEDITRALGAAGVALFVRGQISSGRGSAVAAIASGLPVIGYRGSHTGLPLTEAGVVLVEPGDVAGLAAALTRVLTDAEWRSALRRRSADTYRRHFAWPVIAERLMAELARD